MEYTGVAVLCCHGKVVLCDSVFAVMGTSNAFWSSIYNEMWIYLYDLLKKMNDNLKPYKK